VQGERASRDEQARFTVLLAYLLLTSKNFIFNVYSAFATLTRGNMELEQHGEANGPKVQARSAAFCSG
jgi:hypothetical protein